MSDESYLDNLLKDPDYKRLYICEGFRVEIEERDAEITRLKGALEGIASMRSGNGERLIDALRIATEALKEVDK